MSVGCGSDASPDVSVTDTSTTTTPSVESSAQRGVVFDSEPLHQHSRSGGVRSKRGENPVRLHLRYRRPRDSGCRERCSRRLELRRRAVGRSSPSAMARRVFSDDCAPSASPTLFGTIGLVAPFLDSGYVVAVSDFEGLGTPDPHPYLQPDTAAFNVIDAVRAARNVVPGHLDSLGNSGAVPRRAGILGGSRGKPTPTATDSNSSVQPNLSPAADISPIISSDSEVNLSLPQQLLLPYVLEGAVPHPSGPRTNRLRARRHSSRTTTCSPRA